MPKSIEDFPVDFHPEAYRQEAEKMGEQVAAYVEKGYMNSLRKSDISVRRAFEQRYSAIGYQLEFGVISQETYFDKLESLRDRYFARDTQEWYKYTAEIYAYKKGMLAEYEKAVAEHTEALAKLVSEQTEEVENIFESIATGAKKAIDDVTRMKDAYAKSVETAFGSGVGYDKKVTKIHNYYPTGDTLYLTDYSLSSLEKEIEAMQAYDDALVRLTERAKTLETDEITLLLEHLREMPVEDAVRLSDLLLSGDDETFSRYLSAMGKRQEMSDEIAEKLFQSDYRRISTQVRKDLEEAFSSIPDEFFSLGETVAENFSEGFHARISELFTGMDWILGDVTSADGTHANVSHTYSPVYHLHGSGETIAEQLISARNASLLDALRTVGS